METHKPLISKEINDGVKLETIPTTCSPSAPATIK